MPGGFEKLKIGAWRWGEFGSVMGYCVNRNPCFLKMMSAKGAMYSHSWRSWKLVSLSSSSTCDIVAVTGAFERVKLDMRNCCCCCACFGKRVDEESSLAKRIVKRIPKTATIVPTTIPAIAPE
eukprot:1586469-Rhodomonas_salina.2